MFTHQLVREYDEIWDSLVIEAVHVYPEVLETEIRQAFHDDLVDEFLIGEEDLDTALAETQEERLEALRQNPHYTLVTDTIAEMEWWAAFRKPKPTKTKKPLLDTHPSAPINTPPAPKIGRNDPCHCGSGKKYKKCCWPN